jgi:single-strand DNA-binding protein
MANDINSVSITGRLTKDMELAYTSNGFAIGKLSLASSESKKVGDKWEDHAQFFDCKLIGKRAESLANHLTKGLQVFILGKLQQETWEKDGQKRSKITILIEQLTFGAKPSNNNNGSGSGSGGFQPTNSRQPSNNSQTNFEDDIPF